MLDLGTHIEAALPTELALCVYQVYDIGSCGKSGKPPKRSCFCIHREQCSIVVVLEEAGAGLTKVFKTLRGIQSLS